MSESPKPEQKPSSVVLPEARPRTLADVIQENAPDLLRALESMPNHQKPPQLRAELNRAIMVQMSRSGPLPDPSEISAYNQIIPNGADRIMKMAEKQLDHRVKIETTAINCQQAQEFLGQIFALIIGLAGLGFGTYAALHGQAVFGGIIAGSTLVSLVGAFLASKSEQKKELAAKQQAMYQPQNKQKKKRKN